MSAGRYGPALALYTLAGGLSFWAGGWVQARLRTAVARCGPGTEKPRPEADRQQPDGLTRAAPCGNAPFADSR